MAGKWLLFNVLREYTHYTPRFHFKRGNDKKQLMRLKAPLCFDNLKTT